MKKILALLLIACTLIFGVSFSACDELGAGVVEISTEEQLIAIKNNLDGNYKLTADVLLTQKWKSVGTALKPFSGTFDGNGHTIFGMDVESDIMAVDGNSIEYMVGMFGVLSGKVYDLTIDTLTITVTSDTIASTNYQTLLAQNPLSANLDIHAGLVGLNKGDVKNVSVVADFSINANTSGARVRVGGIAGKSNDSVEDCTVDGDMDVINNDGYIRMGGIAGYVSSNGVISNNTSTANLSAQITQHGKINAGAIVGNIECGIITGCTGGGKVECNNTDIKASVAGGIVGLIDNTAQKYTDMSVSVTGNASSSVVRVISGKKGYGAGCVGQVDFTNNAIAITGNSSTSTVSATRGAFGFIGRVQEVTDLQNVEDDTLKTVVSFDLFQNGAYKSVTIKDNTSAQFDEFTA